MKSLTLLSLIVCNREAIVLQCSMSIQWDINKSYLKILILSGESEIKMTKIAKILGNSFHCRVLANILANMCCYIDSYANSQLVHAPTPSNGCHKITSLCSQSWQTDKTILYCSRCQPSGGREIREAVVTLCIIDLACTCIFIQAKPGS